MHLKSDGGGVGGGRCIFKPLSHSQGRFWDRKCLTVWCGVLAWASTHHVVMVCLVLYLLYFALKLIWEQMTSSNVNKLCTVIMNGENYSIIKHLWQIIFVLASLFSLPSVGVICKTILILFRPGPKSFGGAHRIVKNNDIRQFHRRLLDTRSPCKTAEYSQHSFCNYSLQRRSNFHCFL